MSLINFLRDENGVTAIEYGLIAALIAVAHRLSGFCQNPCDSYIEKNTFNQCGNYQYSF